MSIPVTLSWGNLSAGYCFTTLDGFKNDIFNLLTASITGMTGVVYGPNTPAPADQDKAWLKTDVYGNPIGWYFFAGGKWVWPHTIVPGTGERRIFRGPNDGTATGLWRYDGGDGTDPAAATDTTGGMWMVDTDFGDSTHVPRVPIGAGTNPTTYNGAAATVINQGDTGGAERVTLDFKEMWHRHAYADYALALDANYYKIGHEPGGALSTTAGQVRHLTFKAVADRTDLVDINGLTGKIDTMQTDIPTNDGVIPNNGYTPALAGNGAHQNLPPYLGVYFVKRSARRFFVG